MKLQSVIAAIGLVMAIALPSCSNADTPQMPTGEETHAETIEDSRLGQVLASTIEQSDKTEDNYIVYIAESDEYLTMTASDYQLAQAFASLVVKEEGTPKRVPAGFGWKKAGTGSSKWDAMRIANQISKEIHTGEDFEIRCEYEPDGIHFTVYYRTFPKVSPK